MSIVAFVSAALGLAILVGGALAVAYVYFRRNVTQLVREENADLRDRLRTVEGSEEQCKERLAKHEGTIQVLSDMVTGASAVAELTTVVAFNHDEILKRLDALPTRMARRRAT